MQDNYGYDGCRLFGHRWYEAPSDWDPNYGVPMTVRCDRCNGERRDEVNRQTGEVEYRKYVYPDGYLYNLDEGEERPRRDSFRLGWVVQNIKAQQNNRATGSTHPKGQDDEQ